VETRRVRAGLGEHRRDHSRVLDIEFAPPEAFEHLLVVGAEGGGALALRPEHADGGDRGIPDLACAEDDEAAFARLPPAVHVGVAHPPPLMRAAFGLDDFAPLTDARAAEVARDVEGVGEPVEPDPKFVFEAIDQILGEIRIGALVVGVDDDRLCLIHDGTDASAWRIAGASLVCSGHQRTTCSRVMMIGRCPSGRKWASSARVAAYSAVAAPLLISAVEANH